MTPQQRADQASWLKILLMEQLESVDEYFLYGSVSKIDLFGLDPVDMSFDEESDYDFAVPDSLATQWELNNNPSFRHLPELDYQDNFTTHIYETQLDGCKVQIGLKTDFQTFKKVWSSVDIRFYWECINKRSGCYIGRDNIVAYINQLKHLATDHPKVRNLLGTYAIGAPVPVWRAQVAGIGEGVAF